MALLAAIFQPSSIKSSAVTFVPVVAVAATGEREEEVVDVAVGGAIRCCCVTAILCSRRRMIFFWTSTCFALLCWPRPTVAAAEVAEVEGFLMIPPLLENDDEEVWDKDTDEDEDVRDEDDIEDAFPAAGSIDRFITKVSSLLLAAAAVAAVDVDDVVAAVTVITVADDIGDAAAASTSDGLVGSSSINAHRRKRE